MNRLIVLLIAICVSSLAFAAKPYPEDCPCFDAPINIYEAIDAAPCVHEESEVLRDGREAVYDLLIWLRKEIVVGEMCAVLFHLTDTGTEASYCHYVPVFQEETDCVWGVGISVSNLTKEQAKACRRIAQSISKYVAPLPGCLD